MKKIGFLSFGHWNDAYGSQVRSASDALLQTIELAVAAEELGADGAYVRVHHFARPPAPPFPLLAAAGPPPRTPAHTGPHRNPVLRGGGGRRGRHHLGGPAPARHQPRVARAGHRRLPLFR